MEAGRFREDCSRGNLPNPGTSASRARASLGGLTFRGKSGPATGTMFGGAMAPRGVFARRAVRLAPPIGERPSAGAEDLRVRMRFFLERIHEPIENPAVEENHQQPAGPLNCTACLLCSRPRADVFRLASGRQARDNDRRGSYRNPRDGGCSLIFCFDWIAGAAGISGMARQLAQRER